MLFGKKVHFPCFPVFLGRLADPSTVPAFCIYKLIGVVDHIGPLVVHENVLVFAFASMAPGETAETAEWCSLFVCAPKIPRVPSVIDAEAAVETKSKLDMRVNPKRTISTTAVPKQERANLLNSISRFSRKDLEALNNDLPEAPGPFQNNRSILAFKEVIQLLKVIVLAQDLLDDVDPVKAIRQSVGMKDLIGPYRGTHRIAELGFFNLCWYFPMRSVDHVWGGPFMVGPSGPASIAPLGRSGLWSSSQTMAMAEMFQPSCRAGPTRSWQGPRRERA